MGIPKRRNTSSLFSHSHQHFWHQMCHQPLLHLPGKSTLNIHWKNWCWSSNIWSPDVESRLTGKDPDAGKEWRQEEKGMTGDDMVGWHHQLNGHEFEKTLGDREGWGGLVCCAHVVTKSQTWLNAWAKLDTKWVSCSAVLTLTPEVKSSVYKTAPTSDVSGEIPILLFDFATSWGPHHPLSRFNNVL